MATPLAQIRVTYGQTREKITKVRADIVALKAAQVNLAEILSMDIDAQPAVEEFWIRQGTLNDYAVDRALIEVTTKKQYIQWNSSINQRRHGQHWEYGVLVKVKPIVATYTNTDLEDHDITTDKLKGFIKKFKKTQGPAKFDFAIAEKKPC